MPNVKEKNGRSCGICGQTGHNRRRCPERGCQTETTTPQAQQTQPYASQTASQNRTVVDITRLVYFVFDLETTGLSRSSHTIIEIACVALDNHGNELPEKFSELVRPVRPIPPAISQMTGITNDQVKDAPLFDRVGHSFINFLNERLQEASHPHPIGVLVAHNGTTFDFPFLLHHLEKNGLQLPSTVKFKLDTLQLCRQTFRDHSSSTRNDMPPPENNRLETLYTYCTGNQLGDSAHRASADVNATIAVLTFEQLWKNRFSYLKRLEVVQGVARPLTDTRHSTQAPVNQLDHPSNQLDDSEEDVSVESDDESLSNFVFGDRSTEGRLEPIEYHQLRDRQHTDSTNKRQSASLPEGWHEDTTFPGINAKEQFCVATETSTRNARTQVGVQGATGTTNSPIKAWRSIFTKSILDRIVEYTNQYGALNDKTWHPITTDDLLKFLSILFIVSIQRT